MSQINELIRDRLPDSFQEVAGIAEPVFEDDDLIDFIVPDMEDDGDITKTTFKDIKKGDSDMATLNFPLSGDVTQAWEMLIKS